jgi:DNA-binding beta-propeller fold protein YncE
MRFRDSKRTALLFFAGLALGLLATGDAVQQAVIKSENGIRIVLNPATPVRGSGGKVAAVSLAEDLVIGNDTTREDHWFGFLNALDVDAAGRIYTVDPKSIRVRIFGRDGSLVKALGRGGQGPDEFSGPGGIVVQPGGTFVVSDVLNGRLTYFDRDGIPVKSASFGTYRLSGLAIDRRGNLYITNVQPPSGNSMVWDLLKLDPEMKAVAKVHSLTVPFKLRTTNLLPDRLFYALAGEDRLAWMESRNYPIHVLNGSGEEVLRISRECTPRGFTAEDREAFLKLRFPEGAPAGLEIVSPDAFPAAAAFMTDEKGRIFVRTYETDGGGGDAVDVFDAEGFYVARFFVPGNEDTVTVRSDKLYAIVTESASGNPLVKRYALTWR